MKRLLIVLLVMSWSMSSFAADRVRQLLPNGDFEQGSAIWSEQGVWVSFEDYAHDAHSGTWYVELKDWINGFAAISQQVTVPKGIANASILGRDILIISMRRRLLSGFCWWATRNADHFV